MQRQHLFPWFAISLGVFALTSRVSLAAFDPEYILSDSELTDVYSMDQNHIRSFLEAHGALGNLRLPDYSGKIHWASDIIWYAAQNHGISPKVLLVMLQKEQSLVDDEDPTQKQLDWAMGYGVCDACSMNDPAVQRWQGFGKQVNSAALQFSEGYLADIAAYGVTAGKYGPGIPVVINGTTITPQNAATAALYAYTPHFHGNENFSRLWEAWFGKTYPSGSLVQISGESVVWLLKNGYRYSIPSASVLLSRFPNQAVLPISSSSLTSYPEGGSITLPNYSLIEAEDGERYLLVDDTLRPIADEETFRAIGFSEDELVYLKDDEIATYTKGSTITTSTIAPQGKLYELTTNKARFFVQDGVRHPIFDETLYHIRFGSQQPTPVEPMVLEQLKEGSPIRLPDGILVKSPSSPTVYVISDGMRRPIPSEEVFLSFGYAWNSIVTLPEDILGLNKEGEPLAIDEET